MQGRTEFVTNQWLLSADRVFKKSHKTACYERAIEYGASSWLRSLTYM